MNKSRVFGREIRSQSYKPMGITRRISLVTAYFCIYLCVRIYVWIDFFFPGFSLTQKVTQIQSTISMLEKEAVTLNCTYKTSDSNYYLFWYKQLSSGEMIFLLRQESYNEKQVTKGQYSLNFQKQTSSISLTITYLQLGDSAVYFCALSEATVM